MRYEDKIHTWKSKLLSEDNIEADLCDSLSQKILNVENDILKLGPSNYDKVPDDTITSKHSYYNLLKYDWNELELLKQKIIKNSSEIIGGDKFFVKMWANIYRNGDYIKKHIHHAEPIIETDEFKKGIFNTICGHLFLQNDIESSTTYYFNDEVVPLKNNKGDIHFFSCIVPHEVPKYEGQLRISVAFDVYRADFFENLGIQPLKDLIIIK